ncbi:MAG: oligosaccharide flippase family protein [Akkermansia sp.]|nr:oligosaccharide flippase family protein [Akkermansia sp.]
MMSEIRAGAVLNYVNLGLRIGVPLVLTPYVLEVLGPAEYGLYMLASTLLVRLYLSDLGRTTSTKFLSEYRTRGDAAGEAHFLGMLAALYSLAGAVLLAIGLGVYPFLGAIFPEFTVEELGIYRVLYLMTLVNAAIMFPARSLTGIADSQQKYVVPGVIAVGVSVLNAVGTWLVLGWGWRSVGLVAFNIGTGVLALVLNMVYCFVCLRARLSWQGWDAGLCRGLFAFSWWMLLNQLINMLNAGTGNYLVAMTLGADAATVYTCGLQIYANYFLLGGCLAQLFLPRVVGLVVRGASPAVQTEAMARLGRVQLFILLPVALALIFYGQQFFDLWVGHKLGERAQLSWLIAVALVVPQTFSLVQALGWQISQAREALRQRVAITAFNSMLFIVVSYVVCRWWGIAAQAVWAAVSITIQLLMLNLIHYRSLGLSPLRFYARTFAGWYRWVPALALCAWAAQQFVPGAGWWSLLARLAVLTLCSVYLVLRNTKAEFRRAK